MDDTYSPPANRFAELEVALQQARHMRAPLNARMAVIADAVRALSGEFAEAVDLFVARLQAAGAGAGAPKVGEPMPPFLLPDERGRLVSLKSLLGRGPIVVAFHRGHWCAYCRLNAFALAEAAPRLRGAQIVAVTPELERHTLELKTEAGADFPVLSDMNNGYALAANLAIWVDDAMASLIDAAGWNIPSYNGGEAWILPIPATFVVGSDGIITARDIDPDYRRRMDIERLIEAVALTR